MAGATSVIVVPLETTVVGLSVVVIGGADVSGVFSALDSVGDIDAAEVGLLAAALGDAVAAGAGTEEPDDASGAGVSVVVPAVAGAVVMGGAVVGPPVGV